MKRVMVFLYGVACYGVFFATLLYAIGFLGLFLIGGLTGLFLGSIGLTVHLTDTIDKLGNEARIWIEENDTIVLLHKATCSLNHDTGLTRTRLAMKHDATLVQH